MFSELIRNAEKYKLQNEASGNWRALQLKLNSFSPEFLNIGVVFFSENTGYEIRLLENFDGLKTIMPGQFDDREFVQLLEIANDSIVRSRNINDISLPTPALRLSNPSFFSGSTPESIANWLFEESVTLSKCRKERKKNEFKSRTDEEIKNNVFNLILNRDSEKANSYIRKEPYRVEGSDGKSHYFNTPVLTKNRAGTIANAWYKGWETIKSNILTAQMDISAVSNYSNRQGALFIQRPDDPKGISSTELNFIDNNLDELIWKIRQSNIQAIPAFGVEQLAEEIMKYAQLDVA